MILLWPRSINTTTAITAIDKSPIAINKRTLISPCLDCSRACPIAPGIPVIKDKDGSLKVTKTENGVNPVCFGQTALLGCDVWEHSYYIDFRNKRPVYLKNFVDNLVNWENVASRL